MRRRAAVSPLLAGLLLCSALAVPSAWAHAVPRAAGAPASAQTAPAAVWGCPMCETVRRSEPGTCPRCGMALVPMRGAGTTSTAVPLMPGLPRALVGGVGLLVLVVSFVVLERRARGTRRRGRRLDLLRSPALRTLVGARWFPLALQLPVVALFALVVVAGLFGNPTPERNVAPILTWTVWWASLVLLVVFAGKLWCTVCPWMAIADWLARLVPPSDRPWPRALRSVWPATLLFVVLTWLELGYGVTEKPWLTAVLGLAMLTLALATLVLFERRAFCRYACLVGRVSGLYATFAGSELRAADRATCRQCATQDCYAGNERGAPCPTHQFLGTMRENTYCTLCLECVKTCPRANVAWSLRPFAADLLESIRPRRDEAYLALVMLSMSAFHGLTMTPTWERVVGALDGATGIGPLGAFSLAMAAMLLLPVAVYYAVCVCMRWAARDRRHGVGTLFVRFSYALLPIALFYHLAHNLQHVVFEGAKLVRVASDPFGWGWNVFGTAEIAVGAMLPVGVGWGLQAALIVVGHLYALVIAHRTAHALYADPRTATASQLPMLAAMLLFSFQSLWLLSQPMLMRTAM